MKRAFKLFGIILLLFIAFMGLKMYDFGPEPPRPDLELPLSPQMADPASAPLNMNFPAVNPMAGQGVNPIPHGGSAQQISTPIAGGT